MRAIFYPFVVTGALIGAAAYASPAVRCFHNPLGEENLSAPCLKVSQIPFLSFPLRTQALLASGEYDLKFYKFDDALRKIRRAMEINPRIEGGKRLLIEALYRAGFSKAGVKSYDDAIENFTEALIQQPDYYDARMQRAQAYLDQGRYGYADADFTEAMAQKPDDDIPYFLRGYSYLMQNRNTEALKDFTAIIDRMPTNTAALTQRAYTRRRLQDFQGALEDAAKAVDYEPQRVLSHEYKVQALEDLRRYSEIPNAVDAWESALGKKTANTESSRGSAFAGLGRRNDAIDAFDRAISIDIKHARSYRERGYVKWKEFADKVGALEDFEEAILLGDNRAAYYKNVILYGPPK